MEKKEMLNRIGELEIVLLKTKAFQKDTKEQLAEIVESYAIVTGQITIDKEGPEYSTFDEFEKSLTTEEKNTEKKGKPKASKPKDKASKAKETEVKKERSK